MVTLSEDICFLLQAEAAKFLLEIDFGRREVSNLSLDIFPFPNMSNEVRVLFRFDLSFRSVCLQIALQGQFTIVSIDEDQEGNVNYQGNPYQMHRHILEVVETAESQD